MILIPPSEGKTQGGNSSKLTILREETSNLIKELQTHPNQQKLLGVKGKALEKAIEINKNILTTNTMPAINRYSGVVYKAIDYETLSTKEKDNFNKKIRIISGLFGMLSPTQLIPNYKLKIEKLNSANIWKPIITKELKNNFIIDLLPKAHQKALEYENGIQVDFVIEKQGKKIPAGHNGKHIKGRFIRWLIKNNVENPKDFKKFTEDGFKWINNQFVKRI